MKVAANIHPIQPARIRRDSWAVSQSHDCRVQRVNEVVHRARKAVLQAQAFHLSRYRNPVDGRVYSGIVMLDSWHRALKRAAKLVVKGRWSEAAEQMLAVSAQCLSYLDDKDRWPNYAGDSAEAAECRMVRDNLRSTHTDLQLITDIYYGALSQSKTGVSQ